MFHDIAPSQLRVGMFITSLNRSWFEVPFWRKSFLVADRQMLDRIVASGVETITIDDARGLKPVPVAPVFEPDPEPVVPPVALPPKVLTERRKRPRTGDTASELDRARLTVDRSKAAMMTMFGQARLGLAVEAEALEPLVDEIAASVARDRTAIINVTRLKTKNEYTYLHSVAVCALMMNLARQIGLSAEEVREAGLAGMLHDIGKMKVPEAVLDKPGALDDDERRLVQTHPEQGHTLLQRSADIGAVALDVCLHHHERIDGRGYPYGLTGDQLSIFARMGAICDVYDAVTSERPYKKPWTPGEALARMVSWQGHFDERLLRAFIISLGIFPIGGLVRLRSNRLALVQREDAEDPTTPVVRAFHDIEHGCAVPIEDLASDASGDPILQGESGPHWFGEDWPRLARAVRDALLGECMVSSDPAAPAREGTGRAA